MTDMQNTRWPLANDCVLSSVPFTALPRNREDYIAGNGTTAALSEVGLPVQIEIGLLESVCHGMIDLLRHEGRKNGQPNRRPER